MSGWKSCLMALTLAVWFGTSAQAQGIVPGGWAPQFGYQTFAPPAALGGFNPGYGFGNGNGYGYPGSGYGYSGLGGGYGLYGGVGVPPDFVLYLPSSRTYNTLDPLMGAIRGSTGRRGGGW
jgi:hypothetical protein